jgi:phenylalanyl-tRNA synthetase beta chain
MRISRNWLQTFFEKPLPDAQELSHALTFHAFEIDGIDSIREPAASNGAGRQEESDDYVLDVKVTPNRGHDCLSYRGIAKEISAILDLKLVPYPHGIKSVALEPKTDVFKVTIEEPALCRRFTGAVLKNVSVGPSPGWLVKRLHAMGQQSINNVVDITNFVMFATGQPLHAFDAGKLTEKNGVYSMTVRKAKKGEKLTGLDEKVYALSDAMLAIADASTGEILSIAGVKGGMSSGINESTKTMILEGANWDGVTIRRTSQALKLRTDASQRFEQQVSAELTALGVVSAVEMIVELAGAELVGFTDEYPKSESQKRVTVSVAHTNRLLGTSLSGADVEHVLERLSLDFARSGDGYTITVPFERLDLTIPEDVVEEIGRIVGYDKVAAVELPPFPKKQEINQNFAASENVREELVSKGYSEVFTSVFTDKGQRAVSNKVGGDKPFLRANLTDGLNEALKKNVLNKDLLGLKEVKLFEIGTVWKKGSETVMVGTVSEKEKAVEKPLSEYVKGGATQYEILPLPTTERYETFSRYPYIVRDIALWTPKGTKPDDILAAIRSHAGDLLVRSELFDTFEKGDKVSFAFRLVFQSFDRTLFDGDANERMESIYTALKAKGYEIR